MTTKSAPHKKDHMAQIATLSSTTRAQMEKGKPLSLLRKSMFTSSVLINPLIGLPTILVAGYLMRKFNQGAEIKKILDSGCHILDIDEGREKFMFPPNHPVDGGAYACCDEEPRFYVPLASFHRYMYEAKMAAFQQICSNLGARRCTIRYAEENGQDVTARFSAQKIPTQVGSVSGGFSAEAHSRSSANAAVAAEFCAPTRAACKTETAWMNGEPTWRKMENLRLTGGLESFVAEFSYSDDMGINAKSIGKVLGAELEIGGTFDGFIKRSWTFDVEFWPAVKDAT